MTAEAVLLRNAFASIRRRRSPTIHQTNMLRVPVLASHPDALDLGTTQAGRIGTTARTPASLKGSFDATKFTFVSSFLAVLADECNRPNCQRITSPNQSDTQ
jgi:hypothetical protein